MRAQTLTLGGLFVGMAAVTDTAYALLTGTVRGWLRRRGHAFRHQRYVPGSIYIGLGVGTAFTHSPRHS